MNKILKYTFLILIISIQSITAQLYFFGRNKVQYEKFDWKIIRTDHFDIYYYDDFGGIAEIGAKYAEEAFDELKVRFNHIVVSRIPLIFYNTHIHFQQTNITPGFIPEGVGGFFEFIKGRVVIPYLASMDQFRHVIRHELVHVFMTSKVLNVSRTHRTLMERFPPLWFVEGLAEFWSYHWDTQAEMVLRDAVLNDNFYSLRDINKIIGSFLMYKEGQNFLGFVSEKYGPDKILRIMENLWRFSSFEENLEFTLGDKFEQIDDKWIFYLKQKYFPLYKEKFPHNIKSKKLTESGFNYSPHFYNDGTDQSIYYIGNINGYTSVYKLKYDESAQSMFEPEVVVQGEKEEVFESFHLLKPSMDVSSDGKIAFVTKQKASDALHIYSIKNDEMIYSFQSDLILTIQGPKFSNDNRQIVFSGTDRKGYNDLYIFDLQTKNIVRLTNDYYADTEPVFDENNENIIFVSDRTEGEYQQKKNIFRINLSSYKIEYMTYLNADLASLNFNADHSFLYFTSDLDGTNNIWRIKYNPDHPQRKIEQMTNFATSIFDFSFVDSARIITNGFEKFSLQFYELNLTNDPDSNRNIVSFDFDINGSKWTPEKVVVPPERKNLKYKKQYTLDYAVSQVIADPVYGVRGGAVFLLSDLLGDDKYYLFLYNNAEVQSEILKSFNLAITKVNSKYRTNFGYGIFHFSGRRYDIRESDQYYYERSFGGFFSIIYPFSIFRRLEASVSLANSDKQIDIFNIGRKALLLTNSISFVHDNTLWFGTGPVDGSRFRFLLGYTTDIKYSNVNYYSIIADYRKYIRTGLYSALALRGAIFINDGKEARRYIAGGSWDLRGWPRRSVRGEKLWLSSLEFRFPFINRIRLDFAPFGITLPPIRMAAFFDAGGAWDTKYQETVGSLGLGLRVNIFNALALRYDFGKKIENNFQQLQPRWFWQFFFGWDF